MYISVLVLSCHYCFEYVEYMGNDGVVIQMCCAAEYTDDTQREGRMMWVMDNVGSIAEALMRRAGVSKDQSDGVRRACGIIGR